MTAIALQMLFGDRGKFFSMVVGITLASLIMTQQPSISIGLIDPHLCGDPRRAAGRYLGD
jgi:hypothetical protein